jgi:FemAB-related protein (PEP-CTERM system-associated)
MGSVHPGTAGTLEGELQVVPFEGSPEEWDGLLTEFADSTFCHLWAWNSIISETLGHRPLYRVAVDSGGEPRGLLPMFRVRSRLFGDYLVSMPFLSYGGPLGTENARRALAESSVREARELGVDLLELRSRTPVPGDLRTSHRKLTVILELPESAELLWEEGLKAKVRSQVRRPRKAGMKPRAGLEEMDGFYQVFSRTMRDLGTPVLPRAFFAAVADRLSSQVVVCTVLQESIPVAAGCGFLWNGEVEITWAGSLRSYSRAAPNMLLYWTLIEEAIQRGAHTFNFGRCSPNSGTHRFKRQWGGTDQPLPWAQWAPGSVAATPTPTGGKYALATAVWRKLPLPLANGLGPLISRNLP